MITSVISNNSARLVSAMHTASTMTDRVNALEGTTSLSTRLGTGDSVGGVG